MKRSRIVFTAAAALAFAASMAYVNAASKTANVDLTARVNANCSVTAASIAFGAYDPVEANLTAGLAGTGSVTVSCTKNAPSVILALNSGLLGTKQLKLDGGSDLLDYKLYSDAGHTAEFANQSMTWAKKDAVTVNIYGNIAAGQDVAVGDYKDTVVATVNF